MKREIKFRAWDKRHKKMAVVRDWDFAHGFCELKHDVEDDSPDESQLEIMQFTGLKDKNGKEIYEGDIVKDNSGSTQIVEYGIQGVDAFEGMGWNLWSFMRYVTATGERLEKTFEVIGNIYENPELL